MFLCVAFWRNCVCIGDAGHYAVRLKMTKLYISAKHAHLSAFWESRRTSCHARELPGFVEKNHWPQSLQIWTRWTITSKLAVIVYRALHGAAPQYLSDQLQYVADLPARRRGRLRASTSNLLDVRPSRYVTVGDRSFATAGPRLWNSLPADVRSALSLTAFRRKLKTHLFRQSYPDIVL